MSIDLRDISYRIGQGDHSALKSLYTHYSNSFYQLAYAIVRSREMSEEIVEDVFIRVWKKRSRIAEIENLSLYLFVMVKNISRTYLKKYRNRTFINFDDADLPNFRIDLTPEDIMISGEVIQRVNAAINELPVRCRLIFKLVKEDGLKYREVAELLHLNTKTVENQMGIALKKIHSSLKIYIPSE